MVVRACSLETVLGLNLGCVTWPSYITSLSLMGVICKMRTSRPACWLWDRCSVVEHTGCICQVGSMKEVLSVDCAASLGLAVVVGQGGCGGEVVLLPGLASVGRFSWIGLRGCSMLILFPGPGRLVTPSPFFCSISSTSL